jgi:hypothetical protein
MAARLNPRHSDAVRAKIQASNLITRLTACAMGEIELTSVQLGAINSLLDRSVAKLQQIQHVGDENGGPIRILAQSADVSL